MRLKPLGLGVSLHQSWILDRLSMYPLIWVSANMLYRLKLEQH